ncbi:MAG: hydrogenase [Geminicoccaceae bacterium]|nr:MAG: hydrogenase [Geminicoccaceae bacterium]
MQDQPTPTRPVKIWDAPTRLFHWLLVVLIFLSWLSMEMGHVDRHMTIGYIVLALILFRVVWGLVGSYPSRFTAFVRGPGAVFGYTKALFLGRPPKTAGHNPLGALAILLMLGLVAFQATTGLFADDAIFTRGPLAKLVDTQTSRMLTRWHKQAFDILVIVIAIHVAAAVLYRVLFKQKLIEAMITGKKDVPAGTAEPRLLHPLWALPAVAFAGTVVWYVVTKI